MNTARRYANHLLFLINAAACAVMATFAAFTGLFPLLLCDSGVLWKCLMYGIAFLGAAALALVAPTALALVALSRPGFISQAYLLVYSVLLIVAGLYPYEELTNFLWLKDGMYVLGFANLILVLFCNTTSKKPHTPQESHHADP